MKLIIKDGGSYELEQDDCDYQEHCKHWKNPKQAKPD